MSEVVPTSEAELDVWQTGIRAVGRYAPRDETAAEIFHAPRGQSSERCRLLGAGEDE